MKRFLLGIIVLLFLIGLAFSLDSNNGINSNDINSSEQIDLNVLDQNQLDENTVKENPAELIPKITFVAPLENQIIRGIQVIVVSLQNFREIISHSLFFGGTEFTGTVSDNSLTAELNTLQFENNVYDLQANVCNNRNCYSETISVNLENAVDVVKKPTEKITEVIPEAVSYLIIPSNEEAALSFFDSKGNLIDSSTEQVLITEGVYNAQMTFLNAGITSISLNEVQINSNLVLIDIEEEIPLTLKVPEKKMEWNKIIGVKPNVQFVSGELNLIVPPESDFLFKCFEWNYTEKNCDGKWEKLMDLGNEQIVSIPFSPADPAFGFAKETRDISFGRTVDCPKCGQHKVSPKTTVSMTITAESSEEIQNGVLEEYFPVDWGIVVSDGGTVSDYDSEFGKISWGIGTFTGEISKTYQIYSPERTIPPTDYYFFTSIEDENSDYWKIKVADPATDVNLTVEYSDTGSASGLNTIEPTADVTIAKNTNFIIGMSDEAYTDSINSVTFWTNHGGETGINGEIGYILRNSVGDVTYCGEDGSILNSVAYTMSSDPGCVPTGGWTSAKLDDLNVQIYNRDNGGPTNAYFDFVTITVNYNPDGTLSFAINNPSADNNVSINENENFLVSGTTTCNGDNCGTVDTTLQYCVGAGCSVWYDMNTVNTSPLYLVSGSQPQSSALNASENYAVSWAVNANIANTYELRFSGTGTTATANTSSGTDRTITIHAGAEDYSFTVLLPSSGCTQGKGSYDAAVDCERGYFETTDLAGLADQTEVDAQGQVSDGGTSDVAFIIYDNQSTASNDMNFDIDLNAALPATLKLKVSHIYNGWKASCSGNAQTGCINVTDTPTNIGTAVYSAGTMDLNLFIWGDFVGAGVGNTDRNFYSAGKAST